MLKPSMSQSLDQAFDRREENTEPQKQEPVKVSPENSKEKVNLQEGERTLTSDRPADGERTRNGRHEAPSPGERNESSRDANGLGVPSTTESATKTEEQNAETQAPEAVNGHLSPMAGGDATAASSAGTPGEKNDSDGKESGASVATVASADEPNGIQPERGRGNKRKRKGSVDHSDHSDKNQEMNEKYRQIERKFEQLKSRHFHDKMRDLDREAAAINDGSHPGYAASVVEIEKRRDKRLSIANARKRHGEESCLKQLAAENHKAQCEFMSRRISLRRDTLAVLHSRQFKLKHEKKLLDNNYSNTDLFALPDRSYLVSQRRDKVSNARELASVQEQFGFPGAPLLEPLSASEIEADLAAMGIERDDDDLVVEAPSRSGPLPQPGGYQAVSSTTASDSRNVNPMIGSNSSTSVMNGISVTTLPQREGDRFYHYGRLFEKDDQVLVIDATSGRYTAKFVTATETEVIVQRMDGSKTRLNRHLLKEGKYQIHLKES